MCNFIYGKTSKEMKIVPHSLRGTMATYWASLGVSIMVIQLRGDWLKEETVFKYYINSRYFEEILDDTQTAKILGESVESRIESNIPQSNGISFQEIQEDMNILFREKIDDIGYKFAGLDNKFQQTNQKLDELMRIVSSNQQEKNSKSAPSPKPLPRTTASSQPTFNYNKPNTLKSQVSISNTTTDNRTTVKFNNPSMRNLTTTTTTISNSTPGRLFPEPVVPSPYFAKNQNTPKNTTSAANFFNKKHQSESSTSTVVNSVSGTNSQCHLHKEPLDFCIFAHFNKKNCK